MVMCFAPTCKHYSEKHGCTFFSFPKDPKEKKKWIKLLRRKDREPTKYSRVCRCHFIDGNRQNGPTIFDYNVGKSIETSKLPKRKPKVETITSATAASSLGSEHHTSEGEAQQMEVGVEESTASVEEAGPSGLQKVAEAVSEEGTAIVERKEQSFAAMLEAENYFLKQQIQDLSHQLDNLSMTFSFKQIENNAHLISVYTGLPTKEIFMALFSLFENIELNYFSGWQVARVPKIDQLLLTMMKLKLHLLNDDLAQRFNISRGTVSNIFKTWLHALHEILFQQLMGELPSGEKNKLCMPMSFSTFTNCRVILDCTEMTTIHPKNMAKQRATYSAYKHRNTLKALIGVAPNGVVTFASKLYPGSVSDKKITEHCGILQKLKPGDLVLADKGFLIADLLPQGVSLNLPPFLTTQQFTQEEVVRTRTIAKARIHVERAINRIKSYKILSVIPQTLIPHASVVFQVCAALTNLQFPLIKEVEHLYDY